MSVFVESARLRIEDETSAQLAKIERNLKKFATTARSMQSQIGRVSKAQKQLASGAGNASFMGQSMALRKMSASARRASPAMDKLGTSFASAATKGQRFLTISGQITRQLQAQTAAAQAAAAMTAAGIGGIGTRRYAANRTGLGSAQYAQAAGSRGRRAHAHAYAGFHPVAGAAVGAAFGDMSIGSAVAISALAGVTIHAGRVMIEGARDYSTAKEKGYQAGLSPQEASIGQAIADEVSRKFPTVSAAEALKTYAEATPFSHDAGVKQKLTELMARQMAFAIGRGESGEEAQRGSLQAFKAIDLFGGLKPDAKTGEVDTARMNAIGEAYLRAQLLEGRNVTAGDFRNLAKYVGAGAQALSTEGILRGLLYGSDVGGSSAGVQMRAMDRALRGAGSKQSTNALLKAGLAERDKSGRVHARDERAFARDPIAWMAERGAEGMRQRGLDPFDPEDVKKYTDGFRLAQTAATIFAQSMNRAQEVDRELNASLHARTSAEAAATVQTRTLDAAWKHLGAQARNLGKDIGEAGATQGGIDALNKMAGSARLASDFVKSPTWRNLHNFLSGQSEADRALASQREAARRAQERDSAIRAAGLGGAGAHAGKSAADLSEAMKDASAKVGNASEKVDALKRRIAEVSKRLENVPDVQRQLALGGLERALAAAENELTKAQAGLEAVNVASSKAAGATTRAAEAMFKIAAPAQQTVAALRAYDQYLAASSHRINHPTKPTKAEAAREAREAAERRKYWPTPPGGGEKVGAKVDGGKITMTPEQATIRLDKAGITRIGGGGGRAGLGLGGADKSGAPSFNPGSEIPTIADGMRSTVTRFESVTSKIETAAASLDSVMKAAAETLQRAGGTLDKAGGTLNQAGGSLSSAAGALQSAAAAVSSIQVNVQQSRPPTGTAVPARQ